MSKFLYNINSFFSRLTTEVKVIFIENIHSTENRNNTTSVCMVYYSGRIAYLLLEKFSITFIWYATF